MGKCFVYFYYDIIIYNECIYIYEVIFHAEKVNLRQDFLYFHSSEWLSFDCEYETFLIFDYGKAMEKCLFMN